MINKTRHRAEALIFAISAMLIISIIAFLNVDNNINQTNIEYISSFGWQVEEKPAEIFYLTVPEKTDSVFSAYSSAVGYELDSHSSRRVTRYSYKVLNHKDSKSELIRINLFLENGKILWGDIASLAPNGFVLPLSDTTDMLK